MAEPQEAQTDWSLERVLPPLTPDEQEGLRADIAEHGVRVPVVVDEAGNIIDGHARVAIATELGIPYPQEVRAGLSEAERRIEAVVLNLARRHLTDAQRVLAERAIEPEVARRARERMLTGQAGNPGENLPDGRGRTRDEVARLVSIGTGRTYDSGKATVGQVEHKAPHLMPRLVSGDMTLKEARAALHGEKRGGRRSREERARREKAAVAKALRVLATAMEENPDIGASDLLDIGNDLRTRPDPAALAGWLAELYAVTDSFLGVGWEGQEEAPKQVQWNGVWKGLDDLEEEAPF